MTDTAALARAVLRSNLPAFAQEMFRTLSPGETLLWNWHLDALCYQLERVVNGSCRRLLIEVPPRSLKSVLTSVILPAWLLGRDPTRNIITASYSLDLAIKHMNDCRAIMRSDRYRRLFPGVGLGLGKDTETEFHTLKRGSRYATSPGGTLTGRGGDLLILDDIMSSADANSDGRRQSIFDWYSNTLLSRLNDKQTGAIIVVAQRLHIDDLPGRLRDQAGWEILSLPAISPVEQIVPVGAGRKHIFRAGEVLHPQRESEATLEALRLEMGSRTFSAQYLQQPVPVDGNVIDWGWFVPYDEIPVRSERRVIQSWDIGMTESSTGDWSVCTTWVKINVYYYLLDITRGRWGFPELLRRVGELAQQFRADSILIEDKVTGTALIQQLRHQGTNGVPLPIACKPQGDKLSRMISETAVIEAGHVRLPRRAAWLDDFRHELAQFPNGRHDDQVDSLSQFLHWVRTSSSGGFRIVPMWGR